MQATSRACRLAAAAGAAIGLFALGMGPAHADAPSASLSSFGAGVTLAPGSAAKTVGYQISGVAASQTTFSGVTVTYDVSSLAGVATLVPKSGTCTTAGTLITCHESSFSTPYYLGTEKASTPYLGRETLSYELTPVAGAAAGGSGSFAISISAADAATGSATTTVSLADGPDLAVKGSGTAPDVSVTSGSVYRRSVKFTNLGDQAAQGVTLEVQTGRGVDVPELRDNCQYLAPSQAYCYIPDVIAPGATETLSPSLVLLTTTDLVWQGVTITAVPGYASLTGYATGAGKPFTLVDSTGAAQSTASGHTTQSNIDTDNTLEFQIAGSATGDLAAQLAMYPWMVNGQYIVNADAVNLGTGYISLGQSDEWIIGADFTVPSGVKVVSAPGTWVPVVNGSPDDSAAGQPGYSEYRFNGAIAVAPGSEAGLSVTPSPPIVEPQPGFTGGNATLTIEINGESASLFSGLFGNLDPNLTNDTTTYAVPAYGS